MSAAFLTPVVPFPASISSPARSGLTEHAGLGKLGLQFAISAFCVVPGSLSRFDGALADDHWDPTQASASDRDFTNTGEVREDEYTKQSIYSLLYGLYRAVGKVKHTTGEMYQLYVPTIIAAAISRLRMS